MNQYVNESYTNRFVAPAENPPRMPLMLSLSLGHATQCYSVYIILPLKVVHTSVLQIVFVLYTISRYRFGTFQYTCIFFSFFPEPILLSSWRNRLQVGCAFYRFIEVQYISSEKCYNHAFMIFNPTVCSGADSCFAWLDNGVGWASLLFAHRFFTGTEISV